jgi:hypothetical protein
MKRLVPSIVIAVMIVGNVSSLADEGMWTFDNPPRNQWKERYQFEPSDSWLDHLRLSSVGLENASASFVSADGLIMTNQHVGRSQIAKLSSPNRNLIKDGFYARTRQEELRCPEMQASVLVSYEDITKRVKSAVRPGVSNREARELRSAEISRIERESVTPGLKSEVVTLYNGGEYWLYKFKRYTDVRLVFAAEEQIAYFGGDYDNFTYPRYNLDISFFRAYENGAPAKTEHYLKWSSAGPVEGELIVVSGYPASTARLLTAAQIRYHRDVGNPLQKQTWTVRRDALLRYASHGSEQARRSSTQRLSLDNSLKRLIGQQSGLENNRLMSKKEEDEKKLRAEVLRRPDLQRAYGSAWTELDLAYKGLRTMGKRIAFSTLTPLRVDTFNLSFGNPVSRLATIAVSLVRYADEISKPNDKRYEEFRDSRIDSLKASILSQTAIYPDMEESLLVAWLEDVKKELGPQDPFVRAALGTDSPAQVARRVVGGTKLADTAVRKGLLEGGAATISKSDDPMIQWARSVEPVVRQLRSWYEDRVVSVEASAAQRIAEARFAVYGKSIPPDANSQLRISYGTVLGYEEDTTLVPFRTTFYGLYDRAESFNHKPPYDLPRRFQEGRTLLDLTTPFNFVYTADTIGGNSGSPIVNRAGEIVGVNFDSNIQKLPNRYMYIDEAEGSRAIGVHSAAVIEALKKLYAAQNLADEILAGR